LLYPRLSEALRQIQNAGLTVNIAMWQQGEADAYPPQPDPEGYKKHFRAMVDDLRHNGMRAPVFVAKSTLCMSPPNEIIRQAQGELVDVKAGILQGADTDSIGAADRFDGCHFSESGLRRAAELWFDVIAGWKEASVKPQLQ
jgi:hypothetical protein